MTLPLVQLQNARSVPRHGTAPVLHPTAGAHSVTTSVATSMKWRGPIRQPAPQQARTRPASRPAQAGRRRTGRPDRNAWLCASQTSSRDARTTGQNGRGSGKASGFAHRSFRPDAVRYISVTTAMHRPTVTHADTCRDEKETARRAAFPQPGGRFRRWWQVLGSNQRRLSRRFYRPLLPPPPHTPDLREYRQAVPSAATLSAICTCPQAPIRRSARTATDTVRATRLTCPDPKADPPPEDQAHAAAGPA